MQKVFEKIISKINDKIEHYDSRHKILTDSGMFSDADRIADRMAELDFTREIVKQEAEQYDECYKDCGECEAYDKEKHHCPKFCKVITETVKEIEENHNGWIPCSERLPNQDGEFTDVLITCESMSDGVFVQSAEFYVATDGSPVFDALYHYERVLAWHILPEPYQPKGE